MSDWTALAREKIAKVGLQVEPATKLGAFFTEEELAEAFAEVERRVSGKDMLGGNVFIENSGYGIPNSVGADPDAR